MWLLGQTGALQDVLTKFTENLTAGHILVLIIVLAVSFYVAIARKPLVALLCMYALSLLTVASNPAVSGGALVGRWYFLALAAFGGIVSAGRPQAAMLGLACLWAGVNLAGNLHSPDLSTGMIRGLYFGLVVPAFMLSIAPPNTTAQTLIRFIRALALVGVGMAILHFIFILIIPQHGGSQRITGFFEAPQAMSIATADITLAMIWTLLSKNAGKYWLVILGGMLVNVIVLIASTQRAGLFSLAGAAALMMLFYRGRALAIGVLAGGAMVMFAGPVIGSLVSQDYLANRLSSFDTTGRSTIWQTALQECLRSPVIGHGSGAATFFSQGLFGMKFHQAYIAVFYDFGFAGLLVFVSMLAVGAANAVRLLRSKAPEIRGIGVFTFTAIAMCAVQGLVETGMADTANPTAMLYYLSLGLVAAARSMPDVTPQQQAMQALMFAQARLAAAQQTPGRRAARPAPTS